MRKFQAHETKRLAALDGIELADFRQRAVAFVVDVVLALLLLLVVLIGVGLVGALIYHMRGGTGVYRFNIEPGSEFGKLLLESIVPVLYFGLATYFGNGRTPGKRLTRIRVVSLVHDHMSLRHSIERALGYGAAALEFGFGFAQFFIHPYRRTVQDRIAETIVVKEKSYRELLANCRPREDDVQIPRQEPKDIDPPAGSILSPEAQPDLPDISPSSGQQPTEPSAPENRDTL